MMKTFKKWGPTPKKVKLLLRQPGHINLFQCELSSILMKTMNRKERLRLIQRKSKRLIRKDRENVLNQRRSRSLLEDTILSRIEESIN